MKEAISGFRRYLDHRYPGRSTRKHYMSDLAIFHRFMGDVSPQAVTANTIDKFVQFQSEQGLKATTINRRLCAISSLFECLISQAADDGWRNPVSWKRHSIRPGYRLPRDVSDETVAQLFTVITDRRDRAMFMLMVGAGLRVGEVVNLQLHDLHEHDAAGSTRLRVCGKGDRERIVWLTTTVIHEVQNWLRERSPTTSPYLFLNQHERPLSVAGVQFRLKQTCERANVTLTCHQLRHTFARRLAEHKMPIESLAKVLGHRSLKTTQGYIDGADPTVRGLLLDPRTNIGAEVLYVGTDRGVYQGRRETGETSWTWLPNSCGLPSTYVSDLELHSSGTLMAAATYGRGAYMRSTAQLNPTPDAYDTPTRTDKAQMAAPLGTIVESVLASGLIVNDLNMDRPNDIDFFTVQLPGNHTDACLPPGDPRLNDPGTRQCAFGITVHAPGAPDPFELLLHPSRKVPITYTVRSNLTYELTRPYDVFPSGQITLSVRSLTGCRSQYDIWFSYRPWYGPAPQ